MTFAAHPALVLNADFQPLSVFPLSLLGWQDAVRGVVTGDYAVVAEYERVVRSPSIEMRLPSVLALRTFVKMPRRVAFTRFNLFLRDHFTCQYCRELFDSHDLTFDHVVPRSKGGVTCWTNVVAACDRCNLAKGSRTDMKPARMPWEPTQWDLLKAKRAYPPGFLHETWRDFLYWDVELER